MVVRKRKSPTYKLQIGDPKIKQIPQLKYLRIVITKVQKVDTKYEGAWG